MIFAVWREPKATVHFLRRRGMEQGTSAIRKERWPVFSRTFSTTKTSPTHFGANVDSWYFLNVMRSDDARQKSQ